MNKKNKLGQFFTTNYDYILQNMKIPEDVKNIIEPFAGNKDLLKFIEPFKGDVELYDIEPKHKDIIKRDTLLNPPTYNNKFVLTNPPYLARNKNENKDIYNKYNTNDLYKCFIINLINSESIGGIIIIPLNFICSIRQSDINLRKKFIQKFNIKIINIFEEQVFDDTKYSVCSIFFDNKIKDKDKDKDINVFIYPKKIIIKTSLTEKNNYTIGGEIYNLKINKKCKIERATKYNKENTTNILLKCIDDSLKNKICLKIVKNENKYIDNTEKLSARSYATLVINRELNLKEQEELVNKFNNYITQQREKYNSLFLTNYRESNTVARKRISFELAFNICNYLLNN